MVYFMYIIQSYYSVLLNREIKKQSITIISDEELKSINQKLTSIDKADFRQRNKHVKEVKNQINYSKCPRCGADLIK